MNKKNTYRSSTQEQDMLNILQEEIVIPDIVQAKANAAFEVIQREAKLYQREENMEKKTEKITAFKMNRKKWSAAILAAALAVGTVTVGAAAYMKWSGGMEKELRVTEEQKEMAESTGLADFPEISVTENGVTVTAQQSIVDNYYAYLSFKVEGYDAPEGEQPMFSDTVVTVDGETLTWGAGFYDGLITGEDGKAVLADGSPIPEDENGNLLIDYTMDDGSLEYRINLSGGGEKGFFIGKPIHVELKDLGIYTDKGGDGQIDVEGTWSFDWTLQGDDSVYIAECNEVLGETGATVIGAEISPISIKAVLEMPRQEIKEIGYQESQVEVDGELQQVSEPFEYTSYVEPPMLKGVKLKDGTLLSNLYMGPGYMGYIDEESDQYEVRFAIDRILDVDQVQSLLFLKELPEGEGIVTEENLYVVDIG